MFPTCTEFYDSPAALRLQMQSLLHIQFLGNFCPIIFLGFCILNKSNKNIYNLIVCS